MALIELEQRSRPSAAPSGSTGMAVAAMPWVRNNPFSKEVQTMKRSRLEKIDNETFRPLTLEECRMTAGGLTRKVTGKITFQEVADDSGVDGEADGEIDF